MKTLAAAITVSLMLFNAPIAGADDAHHSGDSKGAPGKQAAAQMTSAEVRKVDKVAKRITLKHEEIKNLDMPPMTMVFRVKDPAMLDKVKLGDKVRFAAEDVAGAITVTQIETAK